MATEIGDFPITHGDFPSFFVCLPEGTLRELMGNWIKLVFVRYFALITSGGCAKIFYKYLTFGIESMVLGDFCGCALMPPSEGEAIPDLVHMPGIKAMICSM